MKLSEYQAVRERAGWFRLANETALEISGKDALSFMQGMVTNNVLSLKEGEGCYAACLTNVGKMVSDLRIFRLKERLLVLLPKSQKGKILEHLDRFLFIEEVNLKDLENQTELLSVQGPLSGKVLSDLGAGSFSFSPHRHFSFEAEDFSIEAVGATHTGERGFDLVVSRKETSRLIERLKALEGSGILEIHSETVEVLRIEAALPAYGAEMSEETIPLEVGLEKAISYEKGCYIGQEVIARIKYLGHMNRVLAGLTLSQPASPRDPIFEGDKEIGRVTSVCGSPALGKPIALAVIRREAAKEGKRFTVKTAGRSYSAQITPLPFYARKF